LQPRGDYSRGYKLPLQVLPDRLDLSLRQHDRHVRFPLRPHNSLHRSDLLVQDMTMKKQQGVESLVPG
jgi:hypothetical protein